MTPPRPHAPSQPPSPGHTPTMSDKSFNIRQWNANGIGNKQTELSIFLEAHNVKVAAGQESKLTAKSRSPNIQNYTLVRQGPGGGLLFFIHNLVSFTHKSLSTTSKNDPHLEELTISIAMDNTVAHYHRVHPPGQFLQWALFTTNRPPADRHRFTSPRRLQCSPLTLALRNNRFERQSTGGFGRYFQLCSPKFSFTHKTPGNADPSSPDVLLASASLITSSNTHDYELIPSAHPYWITDNCHLISCSAQNLHQPQEG